MTFNSSDWYWFVGGDQTKVYSSKRNVYVDPIMDSDYQLWAANTHGATPIDSEASIWYYTKAFLPAWMFNGATFSQPGVGQYTKSQLTAYLTLSQQALFARGVSVNVNAGTSAAPLLILSDGTNSTRSDLGLLALFGQTNPTGTKTWIDNNGNATVLTGAQLIVLATLVGNWLTATYSAIPGLVQEITAGTITTFAQIDAAFAAVPSGS
jgi:hypothetical protein